MSSAVSANVMDKEAISRRRRAIEAQRVWSAVLTRVFLVVMSIIFLIPLYWMLSTALKSNAEMAITPPTILPQSWEWDNFAKAFTTIPFGTYFLNSLLITILNVIGAVVSNLIVAYGFSCIN